MQVNPGRRCRGAGAELRSPHRLPRGANCPETVERGFFFFFFPMGGGILLFCFYGDFGGMFAINAAGGGRPGGSKLRD